MAIFAWGTLALAFGFVALLVFWAVCPYKLIDFNKVPYPVLNKNVVQDGYVVYELDYCKYTKLMPTEVRREFIDGIIYLSADARANVKQGCNVVAVTSHIPESLPAGKYKLRITVVYKPNPIREIIFVNETEEFMVSEKE